MTVTDNECKWHLDGALQSRAKIATTASLSTARKRELLRSRRTPEVGLGHAAVPVPPSPGRRQFSSSGLRPCARSYPISQSFVSSAALNACAAKFSASALVEASSSMRAAAFQWSAARCSGPRLSRNAVALAGPMTMVSPKLALTLKGPKAILSNLLNAALSQWYESNAQLHEAVAPPVFNLGNIYRVFLDVTRRFTGVAIDGRPNNVSASKTDRRVPEAT